MTATRRLAAITTKAQSPNLPAVFDGLRKAGLPEGDKTN
jgi:hypothetical protein